jgi:hypothetical protein
MERWDTYDHQADLEAYDMLFTSIGPQEQAELEDARRDGETAAMSFFRFFDSNEDTSIHHGKAAAARIKLMKISDFAGEDIKAFCALFRKEYRILIGAKLWDHQLVEYLFKGLADVTNAGFKSYYVSKLLLLSQAMDKVTTQPTAGQHRYMKGQGFDVLDTCDEATGHYTRLLGSGLWDAANAVKDLTGAVDVNHAAIETMIGEALTSRFGGNCYSCGKPGHMASKCPGDGTASGGNGNDHRANGRSRPPGSSAWRKVAPTDGVITKTQAGVPYHWCKHCLKGSGHWVTSHTGVSHTGKRSTTPRVM